MVPLSLCSKWESTFVRKEIDRTRKDLQTLQTEPLNSERLFSENQVAEAKVKATQRDGGATLEALSAARGQVVEARELLEQHRSDISTLEAEIKTLQARYAKQSASEHLVAAECPSRGCSTRRIIS